MRHSFSGYAEGLFDQFFSLMTFQGLEVFRIDPTGGPGFYWGGDTTPTITYQYDGPRGDGGRVGAGDPSPQRHEERAAGRRRRRAIPKPRRRVVALVEDVVEARLPQALVDVRSRRRKGLGVARAGRQAQVARP